MQVTLISPYEDIPAIGLRSISAFLKQNGVKVKLIFLPESESMRLSTDIAEYTYPEPLLAAIADLCEGSILVGVSLMTYHFHRSVRLTEYLKKTVNVPVIWGGIHPTIAPLECLKYADAVVLGEGEDALLEIVDHVNTGKQLHNIQNVVVRNGNGVNTPPEVRPPIQNLDRLPFLDYDLHDHYIHHEGKLVPFNEEILHFHFLHRNPVPGLKGKPIYMTIATRGCPHHCAYCCNSTYLNLYKGNRLVRRRSVKNIIGEITQVREMFPFIQAIQFSDDSFFATSEKNIEEFSTLYKKEVGLPYYCLGSPTTITGKKMELLVDAGLTAIQMGIQTGSERIRQLYDRNIPLKKVLDAAKIIHRFADKIPHPVYDIILDNPWETIDDQSQTLKLCLQIPKPREFQLFSLIIFPGTALHDKYLQNPQLHEHGDPRSRFFQQFNITYANILMRFLNSPIPLPILRALCWKPLLYIGNAKFLKPLITWGYWMMRKMKRKLSPSYQDPSG